MNTTLRTALFVAALGLPFSVSAQNSRVVEAEAGVANLLSLAQRDFERAKPGGFSAFVGTNSTSAALAKLCRGEIELVGAARAITKLERASCARKKIELVELPVGVDAVAVVANHANTWAKQVSLDELKHIWLETSGKASSWKQVNGTWPETPLKLYGPGPRLGLTANTRAALTSGAVEPMPELRRDYASSEVLTVVADGVARDRAGLGLLDWATYTANAKRVRLVPVAIEGRVSPPGGLSLRGADGAIAFPLFVYVRAQALEDPGTQAYLDHVLANAERLTARAGLGALTAAEYQEARQRLKRK